MRTRSLFLIIPALAIATYADAGIVMFDDLGETTSVSFQGMGNRISNLVQADESVSFDVSIVGLNIDVQPPLAGFTNLLEPVGSDDPPNTVSDRFVVSFAVGVPTYHVALGSDPDLPAIPTGAVDLTTFPLQGLQPNPYYENGTFQLVGTIFDVNGVAVDTFFIRSDAVVPEPASVALLGTGLLSVLAYTMIRRKRTVLD